MDISSIGSYYSSQLTQENQSKIASDISSLKNADLTQATDDELMEACRQFESYFLEQVFKEMQKTVPETQYSSNATSSMMDYMQDSLIQEYASQATESGSLGLAQMLYEQMKRNYDV